MNWLQLCTHDGAPCSTNINRNIVIELTHFIPSHTVHHLNAFELEFHFFYLFNWKLNFMFYFNRFELYEKRKKKPWKQRNKFLNPQHFNQVTVSIHFPYIFKIYADIVNATIEILSNELASVRRIAICLRCRCGKNCDWIII